MNAPKVSIIIPVYKVEKYIKKCLDSLINQSLENLEFILIDDCGNDNSINIAKTYAEKDSRIIIHYNENNIGSGASRNVGIKKAKGEYIAFTDPDDWVDLDFYEKLYNRAKKDNLDIVKAKRIKVYDDDNNREEAQNVLNKRIKNDLGRNLPLFICFTYEHTTAIFKKTLIDEFDIKYYNIRNGEDNIFLLYVTFFSKSFALIDNTFYYYRIIKTSAIHKIDKEYFASQIERIKLEMEFLNDKDISKEHYQFFIRRSLDTLHSKIELIPNDESELAKYKDDFLREFLKLFNNIKYLTEDKIKNIVDIFVDDDDGKVNYKENDSILKKILKFLIPGKFKKRLKKFVTE